MLPSRDVRVSEGLLDPVALVVGLTSVNGCAMIGIWTACRVLETLISSSISLPVYEDVATALRAGADKRAELRLVKVAGPEETFEDSVSTMQSQQYIQTSRLAIKQFEMRGRCWCIQLEVRREEDLDGLAMVDC